MNVIFEEGGQFKVARVLSATDANYQIELSTGKRSKIKRNNVIFEFEKAPYPLVDILSKAEELGEELEASFLWERYLMKLHFLLKTLGCLPNEYYRRLWSARRDLK